MATMTRKRALDAIRAAGTVGDQAALVRLYTEHRISLATAKATYAEGQRFARFIADRDAKAQKVKMFCRSCGFESVFIDRPAQAECASCHGILSAA